MKTDKYFLMLLVLALLAIVPVTLHADGANKREILTFNQAVEVPGVVLQPGSYIFEMVNPPFGDHMVRVLSEDRKRVYATFFAVPDYRLDADSKVEVTFEERAPGMPPSVRAWFYPGELIGEEFIYHKMTPVAVADNSNVAPSEPSSTTSEASEMTPPAVEPSADLSNSAPAQVPQVADVQEPTPAPAAPEVETTPAEPESAVQPTQLPKTASPISSLTLIGLIALGAAGIGKLFGPA